MTTPAPLTAAPYWERFTNPGAVPVTVPAAQDVVPAGTVQTWPVAGGYPTWPAAAPADPAAGRWYAEMFRVYDQARPPGYGRAPGEVIRVLATRPAEAQWDVLRGDQGSTPTVHDAGFELVNLASADGLAGRAQGVPSGNGLVLPTGTVDGTTWTNDANEHYLVTVDVPAGEASQGAIYQATAFGWVNLGNAGGVNRTITLGHRWRENPLPGPGTVVNAGFNPWVISTPANAQAQACRWRAEGWVTIHAGQLTGGLKFSVQNTFDLASVTGGQNQGTYLAGPTGNQNVNVAVDGRYEMYGNIGATGTNPPNNNSPTAQWRRQGGRAWRAG
jgi:hypothetical protein